MSTAAARTHPASRPERLRETTRPDLRVVEGHDPRRSLVPLVVIALIVLMAAIVAPMVINTQMAETSFAIRDQQLKLNALEAEAWTLQTQLQEVASPISLEKAARSRGMVPAGTTGLISLQGGSVEGGQPAR
ncbi:MAG: hypothetical protein L0H81_03945 [Actinomyces sp.]|nr:hypothetical protein [Actinomyces sp.]MDN6428276.1 hypothetical protein [Propionibacterium sp.]MDN6565510.1 hypothetical protein [Actinomyces sp.]MDN6793917.1 hypothetical protein [Propionibacterium sp.]